MTSVDDITSFVHQCYHSIIEGHHIGQALSSLGEAMLAVLDHMLISHVIKHVNQEDLIHHISEVQR